MAGDTENLQNFEDGECIFRAGDPTQTMYVVQSGEVEISRTGPGGKVVLALLKRGDFLGEMSLLESLPRNADAHARGATKLLAIQPGGFLLKIRRDPTFAFELMQALSGRIRRTNEKLLEQAEKGAIPGEKLRSILGEGDA